MATPADDHSEQSFYWAEFIHELAPLNARTAMQYFETSPWFHIDPPSNNQILRMQTTGMDLTGFNEAEQLRALVGIEFAVAVDQGPALFVIHKQRRAGPNEVYPLEAYYIINNYIQQAPSLYNLISTRLNASVHHMMTSMSTLKSQKPPFTPTKGHTWPILYDPTTAFVKDGKRVGGTNTGRSTAGSVVDGETPGPRGASREPSVRPRESESSAHQPTITMPLFHAIRTTASQVHKNAAANAPPADGPKRVIKSAMALGMGDTPSQDAAAPSASGNPTATELSAGPSAPGVNPLTHASVTGKRFATPQGSVTTPMPGTSVSTPVTERKKKKKRTMTKDIQTPLPTKSPAPTS